MQCFKAIERAAVATTGPAIAALRHKAARFATALALAAFTFLPTAQAQPTPDPYVRNIDLNWSMSSGTSSSEPQVRWPNGEYKESHTDLRVKILGGTLDIARTWSQGRWWLNPAWAPLNFELDPLGRDAKVIERAGTLYERSGQTGLYIAKNKTTAPVYIRTLFNPNSPDPASPEVVGWQWYDRLGNTVDYGKSGRIESYADSNGVTTSFAYDSATTARILDNAGSTVYTFTLAGGLITKVQDQAGRSVSYEWSGPKQTQLTQVTDVMGQLWKYEYDGNGQITTRTDPLGAKTIAQYVQSVPAPAPMLTLGAVGTTLDPSGTSGTTQKLQNIWGAGRVGVLTSQGASETGQTSYLREKRQFEVTLSDKRGNTTVITYDLEGTVLSRTFNGKAQANTLWDGDYLAKQIDARGNTTTTRYDTNRQPLQIIHPDGSQETYTYEPVRGQRTSHTNTLGTVSTWTYDAKGRVTQWVEAKGLPEQRTTNYTYDPYGQLTSKTSGAADGTGADARTQTWQYDSVGSVTQSTDPLGRTTKASYDQRGLPTSQTDALGRTTQLAFNAAGSLTKSTNALNQSVQHQYDARNRRVQTTSAAGKVQKTSYDQYGRVTETLAPGQLEGAGTRITYDALGQATSTTSPSGLIAKTAYDERGRVKTTTDPAGNATSYTYGSDDTPQAGQLIAIQYPTYQEAYGYDQMGRQTTVTQKLSPIDTRTQSTTYDALGQRVANTDPAGRTTLSQYDALGRLTQTTDPLGNTTQQTWGAHDQLGSVIDAKGNTHLFAYDKAGQQTKETRPLGGATQYQYDAAGQLTQRTDAGGNTRSYSYDLAGRMTQETHKLAGTTTDQTISYTYDADGQMTAYEQKDGNAALISSASYTQDAQGRNTQSAITYGKVDTAGNNPGTFSFTLGQGFNADGQLASHTYPDGSQGTYAYDKGQLSKVTLPDQSSITYGSYQWQVPTSIAGPGATKTLTLDALQRPLSIEVKNTSAQILASRAYQYDAAGDITQINSDLGTTQYGYDQLSRLTKATPDQNLQALGLPAEQYSYDVVHNRTSSQHQAGAWSYNKDNQLTQYPNLNPFTPGDIAIETRVAYNAQGHTAKETSAQGEKNYSYNAAERLTQYSNTLAGQATKETDATYRYDPMGRRIAKAVTAGQGSKVTYFLYGETGLIGEADAQGALTRAYGFDPQKAQQGIWSTDPLWQADLNTAQGQAPNLATGASFHYLQTEHLGTPMLATTKAGTVSWKAVSEAFGAAGVGQGSIAMNLRFPGQYFDEESGGHYNFHRDYKPNAGRYLQRDPLGLKAGINIYGYSLANSITNFDDSGLVNWSGTVVTAGLIAGAGAVVMYYDLESECVCNKKVKLKGVAVFGAVGFGAKYTVSGGGSSFYDNYSCPRENAANGVAAASAISIVAVGGASVSATALGSIRSTWPPISTGLLGFDISASTMLGYSYGSGSTEDCCK